MKNLLKYFEHHKKATVTAPLFKLLEAFFDLLVPLVVAQIIDVGIVKKDTGYIYLNIGLLILLALVGFACSITAQYFAARVSSDVGTDIRQDMFDHIEDMSYAKLDKVGTSTLITRLTSDVNQVQTGINMGLRLLLRSPFIVFGSLVMAFTINVRAALVFAVAIPVLSAVVFGLMWVSIPLFRKVQGKLDAVTGLTRENLTGVRVIRAFCKEAEEVKDFDQKNEDLTRTNEFVGKLSALMNPVTFALINIATIVLIQVGAVQVSLGSLQQGEVVALYNYMAQMIIELVKLASLLITLNKSIACANRVSQILALPKGMDFPEEMTGQPAEHGTVAFRHVSMTYEDAGEESLSDIDFRIQKGQTVGIIGGTGSGKSTVVNLIPRFYDAAEGEVLVDGINVKNYPEHRLTDLVGMVPQKAVLFKGSIRDNMKWGNPDAGDEEIWQALTMAQAREVVEGKQGGLDYMLEQNGRNLSGGQKQRLTIARALVKKPEILILDDSASALDFATDAALRKALRTLSGTTTTLIVSQRVSSIMQAELILVMNDGNLAGKGTHEELMKSCEIYQEIYYSQFPEKRPAGGGAADCRKGASA
ncbi:MAG: ABC transporter ATP-binding protein/permease [Lachnospiraceae bacterium]|nr:ABC transporter ATP-binding protein/permease [Lachnospiraceae bacterium]MCI1726965.1 ABC transporter ATP-binding protein/permease [Lachnospiraceae bacterium]